MTECDYAGTGCVGSPGAPGQVTADGGELRKVLFRPALELSERIDPTVM